MKLCRPIALLLCLALALSGCAAKKSVEGGAADHDGGGGMVHIGLPF